MRPLHLGLTLLLFFQAGSVVAQGTSRDAPPSGMMAFKQVEFDDVRAGYVTLEWNDILDEAEFESSYLVKDGEGTTYYRGHLPMAFISGLPDGEYRFDVWAVDSEGSILARGSGPAVVRVEHWSLTQAMSLFVIGLVVFLILVGVIVHGAVRGRSPKRFAGDVLR
ncbi:hypothetical protein [Allorhodopirellula solitaria]|uniref:Fibronectin type-III domain-containing protein n=1 Tax=Allorhodopirellula solitaria TaxID=2527987 RepID=A0A5C5YJZ3_9BACT|nr:hypothetical protein [Allorhodopirellula solitaria]TWT75226.1 hypothetical protein CA85_05150 [Allorhodopirellula solitaria]